MQAEVKKFTEFIAGEVTLVIPVYQRNYNWKTANCEQLFNDIVQIIKNGGPHFIGTFVYQKKSDGDIFQNYIIIDGQQRITTIILLARALYDLADEGLKNNIRSKFLKHTASGEMENQCRLCPTKYDRAIFEKLMSDDAFDENNFTPQEKDSTFYNNYRFFRKKISSTGLSTQDLYKAIYKLNVVSISLQDEKPQEIFESLNSTGLALSKADLIRNYLLMDLDYKNQEELYENYWLKIENLLGSSDKVKNFVIQYLITKRKSNAISEGKKQLSETTLYETFKNYFKKHYTNGNDKKVEDCLCDMYRYAKFFNQCVFYENDNFDELSALDKKFYELTYLLDANNAPIILMYLLDRNEREPFDEATFIKFVDALISLTFRAKVCKRNGITQQFAGNVLVRLDKELLNENSFWKSITFGSGDYVFPNDEEFQKSLMNNKLHERIKSDGCKYFLYLLEHKLCLEKLPAYSEITVEHILPQRLNDKWRKYLKAKNDSSAFEQWEKALGNLTLTNKNEKGSGDTFDKKRERYAHSTFSYTKALRDYSDWTSNQIQARTKKLAAVAIKIWILPEEYNKNLKTRREIFTLDSDFSTVKGERPATFSLSNNEKEISTWRDFLRQIIMELYSLDKDIFKQATKMENVPRRATLFSTTPKNFKIDDDYYMELNFDTETCLKVIKSLVENFDRLGGTNFKEDIWFTLKQG